MTLHELLSTLADRDQPRTEAMVQAEIYRFLLTAPLQLGEGDLNNIVLESPVGDRRRIDIEIGSSVIEVKRDLRIGAVRDDAIEQLLGYVSARSGQTGGRYVGILTDGCEWICYHLDEDQLSEVSRKCISATNTDVDGFVVWLEGVLATVKGLPPTPSEVRSRLGAHSSSYALDRATISALYNRYAAKPTVQTKRRLWSRLLTSALGTQFDDSDELFIEHTLLVNSAELIAHAVLGLPVSDLSPEALLSGAKFDESGIYGVVESDFFDWVLEVEGGSNFIRSLSRRLGRFDWGLVEHDILKVLYESIIGAETRKRLGEYYTPDWLAESIVEQSIDKPLDQRVLDPACGSGTFLFHAVRHVVRAAVQEGLSVRDTIDTATRLVVGMDLHPVAVAFARVTYLLAIGRERILDADRGDIQIPVYLGDSMQWNKLEADLWTDSSLVIDVKEGPDLFPEELRFPESLLKDAKTFDRLVSELAEKASHRKSGTGIPSMSSVYRRLALTPDETEIVSASFSLMCKLHDEGRDHIWGYFIRNLARPLWLSREENRVDIMIGNPPWLAYRHMSTTMQSQFRRLSESRHLWEGASVATQQDLSALFLVRATQLYLQPGGMVAMVMPNAVLDRAQFKGFRTGDYSDSKGQLSVAFDRPAWDLRRIRPHFFPRGAAVVFGQRSLEPSTMPMTVIRWTGRIPVGTSTRTEVLQALDRQEATVTHSSSTEGSLYRKRFSNGASVFPRLLFTVQRGEAGPLGLASGNVRISSLRSKNENRPWKDLDSLNGVVESQFVRPVLFGEHVVPYRVNGANEAIVPEQGGRLLAEEGDSRNAFPGLAAWWEAADEVWKENRKSESLSLLGRLDYHKELSTQFPIHDMRVVYSKSGMHLAAALVQDLRSVVDHTLYWAPVRNPDEGHYLCGVLNSATVTEMVRPYMSYGKDERHIDKHVWNLPIPEYDESNVDHRRIVELAKEMQKEIDSLDLDWNGYFVTIRRKIRAHIASSKTGESIDELVFEMLS